MTSEHSRLVAQQRLANRMGEAGASVFTEMSELARRYQAVNLGQGFPDFAGPLWVKEAAQAAILGDHNQYAPSQGVLSLRNQVAAAAATRLGRVVDPETEVTITSGATEGVFAAMEALLNSGDEVIVFDPAYESYGPAVSYPGGVLRPVLLRPPDHQHSRWWYDTEDLRRAAGPRARILLLNSPHNPTAKAFSRSEMEQLAAFCQERNLLAVTDEVYEYLVFGVPHISLASLPGMWERTLTISSSAKTFSLTGWKIGWAVGPADLIRGVAAAHQSITFCAAAPLQEGIAAGFAEAESRGYYQRLQAEYAERREFLLAALNAAGLPPLPCEGSYFILSDIVAAGYRDDAAFCRDLTVQGGVTAIPPSAFYAPENRPAAPPLARFAFCKEMATLEEAGRRLARWRKSK